MRPACFAALAWLFAPSVTLIAQEPARSLEPGARLRLTYPCEHDGAATAGKERRACRSEGRLVLLRADTIALAVAESTMHRGLNAINRIEVSRGHRAHRLAGAGVGFLVGAGVTFALLNTGGSTSLCNQSANQDAIGSGECLGLAALGGLAGAGLGVIIGGFVRTERWQDVPLDRLRVSLTPQTNSMLGLAVAVVF